MRHDGLDTFFCWIEENTLLSELLALLGEEQVLMAAIVGYSESVGNWSGFRCKLEGCIHWAESMIIAREGGLKYLRVF